MNLAKIFLHLNECWFINKVFKTTSYFLKQQVCIGEIEQGGIFYSCVICPPPSPPPKKKHGKELALYTYSIFFGKKKELCMKYLSILTSSSALGIILGETFHYFY